MDENKSVDTTNTNSDSKSNALKVLFVDNSRTTRAVMSLFLEQHGYNVTMVATGAEAIERIKIEPFDVAIMDLYMPFMNGYEAARIIRELPEEVKNIPIIALTASQDPRDIELCHNAGMNDYIQKSADNKALLETLEKYKKGLNAKKGLKK